TSSFPILAAQPPAPPHLSKAFGSKPEWELPQVPTPMLLEQLPHSGHPTLFCLVRHVLGGAAVAAPDPQFAAQRKPSRPWPRAPKPSQRMARIQPLPLPCWLAVRRHPPPEALVAVAPPQNTPAAAAPVEQRFLPHSFCAALICRASIYACRACNTSGHLRAIASLKAWSDLAQSKRL